MAWRPAVRVVPDAKPRSAPPPAGRAEIVSVARAKTGFAHQHRARNTQASRHDVCGRIANSHLQLPDSRFRFPAVGCRPPLLHQLRAPRGYEEGGEKQVRLSSSHSGQSTSKFPLHAHFNLTLFNTRTPNSANWRYTKGTQMHTVQLAARELSGKRAHRFPFPSSTELVVMVVYRRNVIAPHRHTQTGTGGGGQLETVTNYTDRRVSSPRR
ncbi:unnamed protein product [Protopolystoma xenopodis]|uniref:Uncharacterized protein n=1 Tax=Protopolystoma xenopodis TaxID=117903 RepID=A0A448WCY7_9PLAT|nr:unnamed protein product [Protopolystoma xenopodis]